MRISDWSSDVCSSDLPSDIRHVNHAVDVAGQTDEQAEFGRVLDFALYDRADGVRFGKGAPGVRLFVLETERDGALVAVDLQHQDIDFLAGRIDVAGVAGWEE